jgi:hypothetical protein
VKLLATLLLFFSITPFAHALSDAELSKIGHRIWVNECDGTVAGLTSWNNGENFASLGIGHFIWVPRGVSVPFEESFPDLVRFFHSQDVKTPDWLSGPCPWSSRREFQQDQQSPRMKTLRNLLVQTLPQQAEFLARRMRESLPKMLAVAKDPVRVRANFGHLSASSAGTFALIDYVNFKGEGTLATERYRGEGWGLLQVLEAMRGSNVADFSTAAAKVLTRRVQNAPAARHEERWLPGWKNRVARY